MFAMLEVFLFFGKWQGRLMLQSNAWCFPCWKYHYMSGNKNQKTSSSFTLFISWYKPRWQQLEDKLQMKMPITGGR